jgi:hypothetical protein
MPSVSSLDALERAVAGFEVSDLGLEIDPPAQAVARRSLDESGLLLLGEVHGVRENPLVFRALMQAFGLNALALEWPDQLAPVITGYLTGGVLADHPALWLGDGRITAGHLAMLSERAAGGHLDLTLFDRVADAGWTWSQRDEAMAEVILARAAGAGTLAVAGNAHTATRPTGLGFPLGACLARQRPGVRDIRISYSGGRFYNLGPRQFQGHRGSGSVGPGRSARPGQIRLHLLRGSLILDLPQASEATVPHRPVPGWSGALPAGAGDAS